MSAIKCLVGVFVLALAVGSAKADVVQDFSLIGTAEFFDEGAGIPPGIVTPFLGQMTLDTTTGLVLDFSTDDLFAPTEVGLEFFQTGNRFGYTLFHETVGIYYLFDIQPEDSLISYTGGAFTGSEFLRHSFRANITGTITKVQAPAPIPLPAALPLFLTGLVGLIVFGFKRVRA